MAQVTLCQRDQLKKCFEVVHPHHAMGAQEGLDGDIIAGDGAGMRLRQRIALLGSPDLIGNDRFAARAREFKRCAEGCRVADRFEKKQDDFCLWIVCKDFDDLADRDVALVADRNRL